MNEYISPQAFAGLHELGRPVRMPEHSVAILIQIIPTHPVPVRIVADGPSALRATNLAWKCNRYGIPLFDTNDPMQEIEHVVAPEHGIICPGIVNCCGFRGHTVEGESDVGLAGVAELVRSRTSAHAVVVDPRTNASAEMLTKLAA